MNLIEWILVIFTCLAALSIGAGWLITLRTYFNQQDEIANRPKVLMNDFFTGLERYRKK